MNNTVNTVRVCMSAPALSLLIYENIRCPINQEGFLLGKKCSKTEVKITDNDRELKTIEWEIHISSIVPCPKLAYYYSNTGLINTALLSSFVNELTDDIVGWYSFKRTSEFRFNLREKILHKRLSTQFSFDSPEHFIYGNLVTIEKRERHVCRQTFLRYNNNLYEPLQIHIVNLSDAQNEYKSSGLSSPIIDEIINSVKKHRLDNEKYGIVEHVDSKLSDRIKTLVDNLSDSEQTLYKLQCEVMQLQYYLSESRIGYKETGIMPLQHRLNDNLTNYPETGIKRKSLSPQSSPDVFDNPTNRELSNGN